MASIIHILQQRGVALPPQLSTIAANVHYPFSVSTRPLHSFIQHTHPCVHAPGASTRLLVTNNDYTYPLLCKSTHLPAATSYSRSSREVHATHHPTHNPSVLPISTTDYDNTLDTLPIASGLSLDALRKNLKLYAILSKDKLSLWVALSTLPGVFLGGAPPPFTLLTALLGGTFLSSASACAFNQLYERHKDKQMIRTKKRPLVSEKLEPKEAMVFATAAGVAGVGLLALGTTPLTAALAATNIGLYTLLYTPLKVLTPYNTHVGSIVGSLPILMGCTAVGASLLTPTPWTLFGLQVLWQFPHFYSLAWLHRKDYLRAGFRMFPLSDATGHITAQRCKRYLWALFALPFVSSLGGVTSWMFVVDALIPNLVALWYLSQFEKNPSNSKIRKFFAVQLWQLLILLLLTVYHTKSVDNDGRKRISLNLSEIEKENFFEHSNDPFFRIRSFLIYKCPHVFLEGLSESCFVHILKKLLPFYSPMLPSAQLQKGKTENFKSSLSSEE